MQTIKIMFDVCKFDRKSAHLVNFFCVYNKGLEFGQGELVRIGFE